MSTAGSFAADSPLNTSRAEDTSRSPLFGGVCQATSQGLPGGDTLTEPGERVPQKFSRSLGLSAAVQVHRTQAVPPTPGKVSPGAELGGAVSPWGLGLTLSTVLVVPCHTDGHGKPKVNSSWTVSDLDVGPDCGSSGRSADPFANRMSAGRPRGVSGLSDAANPAIICFPN